MSVDNITVIVASPAQVGVTFAAPQGATGPPGAQGQAGPIGPQGVAGIIETWVHAQEAPTAVWVIAHDLNRFPSVEIVDSSGSIVEGDLQYFNANTVQVSFSAPFSGVAYLN